MREGTCIHFSGRGLVDRKSCCDAGVNFSEAFDIDTPGVMMRMPCVQYRVKPAHGRGTHIKAGEPTIRIEIDRKGFSEIPCSRFKEPTQEEIDKERRDDDADHERSMTAIRIASAWRTKPKPAADRREVVECPICKGSLHLYQSSYNGHVHGKCATVGCVTWME